MYKIYSTPHCHHIIDNSNYYTHCVEASKYLDETNGSDNERFVYKFNVEYNDHCVSTFRKTVDNDDDASTTVIILSIACNTFFDKLSDNPVFKNIDKTPGTIAFQILIF